MEKVKRYKYLIIVVIIILGGVFYWSQIRNSSCTIKGNIGSGGDKIYHVSGCGSYEKTTIDKSKGERWFCSEQDALDAGWRKALNCN